MPDAPVEDAAAGHPEARPGTLLTPAVAAATLRVDRRTLARWADEGRLSVHRTPGGHRRYPAESVINLLDQPT